MGLSWSSTLRHTESADARAGVNSNKSAHPDPKVCWQRLRKRIDTGKISIGANAFFLVVTQGARMESDGRADDSAFQCDLSGRFMNGDQILGVLEDGFCDLIGKRFFHLFMNDQKVCYRGNRNITLDASIHTFRNAADEVQQAIFSYHLAHSVAMRDETNLDSGGRRQIQHCSGRPR